jgi:alanyl-tRNA synthetase
MRSSVEELPSKINNLQDENESLRVEIDKLRQEWVKLDFESKLSHSETINGIPVLAVVLNGADLDTMRSMTDLYRSKYSTGIVALGSVINEKPMIICAVTEDLVKRGYNAGDIVRRAAAIIGGSGGGRPILAQAGGKDAEKLPLALASIPVYVAEKTKDS